MPGFFNKLLGKDPEGRARSVQVLANLDSASSIPKLITALGDEAVEVRRAAASALEPHGRTGDARAIAALITALNDSDSDVRKYAALSLGEFISRSPAGVESGGAKGALVRSLENEHDESVLRNVVVALAQINDPAMVSPMVSALRMKDKAVIRIAIDAINDLPSTDVRLDMKKGLRSVL
jgi:HEAT repeat protein